ncbi:MAG: hypothetical protein JWQ72_524 [Polaromonas sp.]|nr:hypothetical protein [Polaromonas sp.]
MKRNPRAAAEQTAIDPRNNAQGVYASAQAAPGQAPLGSDPSYDAVLDLAVEYTFPCSDPIAVDGCCYSIEARRRRGDLASAGGEAP